MSYEAVQGANLPPMPLTMTANYLDVVTDVVVLRYLRPDGTSADHALVVLDALTGSLECRWLVAELEQVGTYYGIIVLTRTVGAVVSVLKLPVDGSRLIWNVYPSIPAP